MAALSNVASHELAHGKPRTFHVNGTTLFAEEFGPAGGIPALLLPGGPGCSHEYLNPIATRFADRLHSFVLDPRGWGKSSRPPLATMTHAQMVDDFDAVRKALGFDRWLVLGHSYGGFLALEYAIRIPNAVSALTLIGSGSAMDMGHLVAKNVTRLARKYPQAYEAFTRGAYEGENADAAYLHHMQAVIPLFFKDFDEDVAAPLLACTFSAHGDERMSAELRGYDVTDALPKIGAPTLVIDGVHDFILPPEQQKRLHSGIPGSRLVLLESSGHFPFLEDPAGFDKALGRFLDQSSGKP